MKKSGVDYTIVRSNRKTVSVIVRADASVEVRAPRHMTPAAIDGFVARHRDWIKKNQEEKRRILDAAGKEPELTEEDLEALKEKAAEVIPRKADYFAKRMGVDYAKITIRVQKARWGSCTATGHLSFNALLMLMPDEIADYLVVHELAHRKEMNHSAKFWAIVGTQIPDYKKYVRYLKEEGVKYLAVAKNARAKTEQK